MIRCAVLGSPISHSLSPALHRCAYKELGINGEYSAIDVGAGKLHDFIDTCDESWTGFSLTMPLKEEAIALCTSSSDLAKRINSANTLIRAGQGWSATTTDVPGFVDALSSSGFSDVQSIAILGSGATARSAVAAFDRPDTSITVFHRSSSRELAIRASALHAHINFLRWGSPLPAVDLLINTTPSGVADEYAGQVDEQVATLFFEVLYNPWPTKLLQTWRMHGGESLDGLDLLVHQALHQLDLMTGSVVDHKTLWPILRKAGLEALKK